MKIKPFVFFLVCILFGAFGAAAIALPVDWKTIKSNQEELTELRKNKAVYKTMKDNIGIWCELAVHYDWIEPEDHDKAGKIIESGVHNN